MALTSLGISRGKSRDSWNFSPKFKGFGFSQVFYAIFRDFLLFWVLGFSKILGFFKRFFLLFDEVYEDFQSNLPLEAYKPILVTVSIYTI